MRTIFFSFSAIDTLFIYTVRFDHFMYFITGLFLPSNTFFPIKMNFLTFEEIEGKRKNSKLIWIVEEQYLYFKKDERADGRKVYLCYQNRIDSNQPCPARRSIDSKGIVTTNTMPHSNHTDHRFIYEEMNTKSAIVNSCIQAATALKDLHVSVPNQQIFTRELFK